MSFNYKIIAITLLSVTLLGGCASKKTVKKIELAGPDVNSLKELMSVSIEARDEMRILAKTQEAIAQKSMTKEQHAQRYFNATTVPAGFEKKVDLNITDSASKVAEAIAMMAGYTFIPSKTNIPNEPFVRINIKNEPLNEALRELGVQTGDTMRVEVHAKVLRIVYKH